MRIAVCLSGQVRTAVENFTNIKNFLGDIYNNCDFFMHCWDDCSYKTYNLSNVKRKPYKEKTTKFEKIYELYSPKKMHIDDSDIAYGYNISKKFGIEPLWYSFLKSVQYKKQYELDNGFEYDFIIKLRYDVVIALKDNVSSIKEELQKIKNNAFYINNYEVLPGRSFKDRLAYDVIFISKSKEMDVASNYFWEMAKNYDNNDSYINLPHYLMQNNIETKRIEFIDRFLLLRDDYLNKNEIDYSKPIDSNSFEKIQTLENYYFSGHGSNPLDRLFIDDLLEKLKQKEIYLDSNTKYYLENLINQL
jgi:hypothetical protein